MSMSSNHRRGPGRTRKIGASNLAQLSMGPPGGSSAQRLGPHPMPPSLDHPTDNPRSGANATHGGTHNWVMVRYIDAFVVFVQRSMSHLLFTSIHQKALYKLLVAVLRFMFPTTSDRISSSVNNSVHSFPHTAPTVSPHQRDPPSSFHASRTSSRDNLLSEGVEPKNTNSIHSSVLFHSESIPAGLVP